MFPPIIGLKLPAVVKARVPKIKNAMMARLCHEIVPKGQKKGSYVERT